MRVKLRTYHFDEKARKALAWRSGKGDLAMHEEIDEMLHSVVNSFIQVTVAEYLEFKRASAEQTQEPS